MKNDTERFSLGSKDVFAWPTTGSGKNLNAVAYHRGSSSRSSGVPINLQFQELPRIYAWSEQPRPRFGCSMSRIYFHLLLHGGSWPLLRSDVHKWDSEAQQSCCFSVRSANDIDDEQQPTFFCFIRFLFSCLRSQKRSSAENIPTNHQADLFELEIDFKQNHFFLNAAFLHLLNIKDGMESLERIMPHGL